MSMTVKMNPRLTDKQGFVRDENVSNLGQQTSREHLQKEFLIITVIQHGKVISGPLLAEIAEQAW